MYEQNSFFLLNLGRREASYGAGVAAGVDDWYKFLGPGLFKSELTEDNDQDEINGARYPTESSLVSARTSGEVTFKMNIELLPFFLGMICGNIATSGSSDPYTHVIDSPGISVVSPWSTGLIQAHDRENTASIKGYNGVVVTSLEFEISDAGAIEVKVSLKGDGTETDQSAITPPSLAAALAGTRLLKKDISALTFGPSGGTVDLLSGQKLRKLSLKLEAGVSQKDSLSSGLYAGEANYDGNGPVLTGELVVKGRRGDDFYNAVRARTVETFAMTIQQGADDSFSIAGNSVRIPADAGVTPDYDESGPILTLPLRFDHNVSDARAFRATILNGVSAYLASS
jgi:Phage tail tube protein